MPLILNAIKMNNFKSFKNEHTIDGLNSHINAIIGPNGSGKSNIIDSILFVLGYRAKKMRHGVLKDLITKGCSECYVELKFNRFTLRRELEIKNFNISGNYMFDCNSNDLGNGCNAIDISISNRNKNTTNANNDLSNNYGNAIISISNRNKNATNANKERCVSRYKINGNEISSTEFLNFIVNESIDIENNRFLILQGEIESISLLGPLELLHYIEDCVGTRVYEKKIEEIENEIGRRRIENNTLNSSYKFIESDFLYKKGKIDEKLLLLENKMKVLENKGKIVLIKNEVARRRMKLLVSERKIVSEELESVTMRRTGIEDELKKCEAVYSEKTIGENELLCLRSEIQRAESINARNEEQRSKLEREIADLENKLRVYKNKHRIWKEEYEANTEAKKNTESEMLRVKADLMRLRERLYSNKEVVAVEKKRKEYEGILCKLLDRKDRVLRMQSEIELHDKRRKELLSRCDECMDVPMCEIKALEEEIAIIGHDIETTEKEILRRERQKEEYCEIEKAYQEECAVYEMLRNIPGVCGSVKMLGSAVCGYEIALDCATNGLSDIVVETTAVAEQCIDIIRQKKMRRTSFIVLDKLGEPRNATGDLLYKRVVTNERFRRVFWHLLGDTIVCDGVDEARRIAFGQTRRRVVTKDGKLFERSGVMNGGKIRRKIKGIEELREAHERMSALQEKKKEELGILRIRRANYDNHSATLLKIKEIDNLVDEIEKRIKNEYKSFIETNEVKNYITNSNKFNNKFVIAGKDDNISFIDEFIAVLQNVKEDIEMEIENCDFEKYNFGSQSEKIRDIVREINSKGTLIEQLEKANQKIISKIRPEPLMDTHGTQTAIEKIRLKYMQVCETPIIDCQELKEKENEYKRAYEEMKTLYLEIGNLRKTLNSTVRNEANLNGKIEEIDESIRECERIIDCCAEKTVKLKKEFLAVIKIKDIISQNNIEISDHNNVFDQNKHNSDLNNFEQNDLNKLNDQKTYDLIEQNSTFERELEKMNDEEIRLKNSELMKLVNTEESQNMHDYGIEDVSLYKSIFLEYEECAKKYNAIKKDMAEMDTALKRLGKEMHQLKEKRLEEFMTGFTAINKYVREIFSMLTFGGNAELDLVNFLDLFSEGITYNIMPCKKSWKPVSNLSGGEKTLASLSLIFALHRYKPSSFYVMDEIDAALDYKNVYIIAQYIAKVNAQFLIISLRENMFESVQTLIGVYKNKGLSKAIVVDVNSLL